MIEPTPPSNHTAALLVVDVQAAAVESGPFEIERVLGNIATLLSAARDARAKVVFIQHDGSPGEPDEPHTPGWAIHSAVAPLESELVFRKEFNSAFRKTGLHDHLQKLGVDTIVVVGIQTEYCVDTTVRVAFELGYSVVVPEMTNTTMDNGPIPAKEVCELVNRRILAGRFASVVSVEEALEMLR